MDCFSLCLDGLYLAGQSMTHILFTSRLTGKKAKIQHFAAYFSLLCTVELISAKFHLGGILSIGAGVLVLYGMSRFALENQPLVSWTSAVLSL